MKLNKGNQTLKQINKKSYIEDYFKDKRKHKKDVFHKFVKDMQRSLEIILIYSKNLN